MRASSRKLLLVVLGLSVLGFIIYRSSGFINLADFSGAKLWLVARNANPYYLLLSLVGIYACYLLRALRWQVLQSNLGPSSLWTIYKLTLAGFSAIFLLGRAGEPIRPLLLARKEKLPIADMFGVYVLERLFDTASTAIIIVATAASIMPRRPIRAAMELSRCSTAIVLPAKIAKTTVMVRAER